MYDRLWVWCLTPLSTTITNKTDRHDIAEMLLKVALNTIPITYHTLKSNICFVYVVHSSPVSSINKTDRHDIAEMLLKVALNTIPITFHTLKSNICFVYVVHSTPVSSTINKTDRHDIAEMLLKVALNTIPITYHTLKYSPTGVVDPGFPSPSVV
jgi:uncharacterized protein (UPF0297 family)